MTKPILTINDLIQEAKIFCEFMSSESHSELLGVTDGKAEFPKQKDIKE